MLCHKCHKEISVTEKLGFRAECPLCSADLHVCVACQFYERGAYNDCRESQADRVVDKERANFCEYFRPSGGISGSGLSPAEAAKQKLAELFKKP